MGETPDTPNKAVFNKEATTVADGFNIISLNGLKPGTKYYFRLLSAKPLDEDTVQFTGTVTMKDAPISFETSPAPAVARVLYVAPDGDDKNSGLSRAPAWRTVTHAGDAARAGDTVIIAGGTYIEIVRVRASGSESKPITFKAAPGEKVFFSGNKRLINNAFSVVDKQHINLDGFYFEGFTSGGWKSVVDLRFSDHLMVTRCFFNGYGTGSVGTQLRAQECEDVIIRNCVFARGFQGMVTQLNTTLLIENNVFMNNLICPIVSSDGPPKTLVVKNNIFVDSIPCKVQVHFFEMGGFDRYHFDNNAFYLRLPDAERKALLVYGDGPGRISVADYDEKAGTKNMIVADPQFAISAGQTFVDRTGKRIPFLGD